MVSSRRALSLGLFVLALGLAPRGVAASQPEQQPGTAAQKPTAEQQQAAKLAIPGQAVKLKEAAEYQRTCRKPKDAAESELEADEDEARFEEAVKKVAKAPPAEAAKPKAA